MCNKNFVKLHRGNKIMNWGKIRSDNGWFFPWALVFSMNRSDFLKACLLTYSQNNSFTVDKIFFDGISPIGLALKK